jgi:hemerythrin-like metal-binding protein
MGQWKTSWNTGVKKFDDEHKRILEFIDEIEAEGMFGPNIGKIFDDVIKYAEYHFSEEEKTLKEYKYPRYKAQQKAHKELIKQLVDVRKFHKKNDRFNVEPKGFLLKWLITHIQTEDKLYTGHLAKAGYK